MLGQVRDRVNEGAALADAMAAGGGVFPDLYVGMVRAGEAGGALETVLERLADYLESQVRLRNKVSSIVIYPAMMFLFACVVVGILVTVVLPQITELLASLNQPLPFYTRWIIAGSHFTRDFWWAIAASAVGFVVRVPRRHPHRARPRRLGPVQAARARGRPPDPDARDLALLAHAVHATFWGAADHARAGDGVRGRRATPCSRRRSTPPARASPKVRAWRRRCARAGSSRRW